SISSTLIVSATPPFGKPARSSSLGPSGPGGGAPPPAHPVIRQSDSRIARGTPSTRRIASPQTSSISLPMSLRAPRSNLVLSSSGCADGRIATFAWYAPTIGIARRMGCCAGGPIDIMPQATLPATLQRDEALGDTTTNARLLAADLLRM